jgi:hypothetical protein
MAVPLDPRLVYAKTAAGVSEVLNRGETLSAPARRVLVLIDGRRPLAQLPQSVRPGELPKLIDELLAAGLIALSGIVEELPGGSEMRDPRLEDFKRRIEGAVERELGPAGRVLEARLQDCVNMTVMRGVMRELIELVRARRDDAAARRVAEAAQAAARAWAERGRQDDADAPRAVAGSPPDAAAGPQSRDRGRTGGDRTV